MHRLPFETLYFIYINIIFLFFFVNDVLSYENCSFQANIERSIDEIGFHRNVEYKFSLTSNCSFSSCKFCLQEYVPSGLFINKDQLDDLLRVEQLSAAVVGNVDIEAPASLSQPLVVRIFKELNSTENEFSGNARLPIHIRYHDPQPGGGFRDVKLGEPELYVYCSGLPLNLSSGAYLTKCAGKEVLPLPYRKVSLNMEEGELILKVPVGDSDSFGVVFAGTFAVVIAGSIYLAGVLYKI